jgi:ketosteroid isomerase-like protein
MTEVILAGDALRAWFRELEACVGAVDYDRAERIFAPDVMGFGTYKDMAEGREVLRREQWSKIWPTIRDFRFRLELMHWRSEGTLAWAACPWESTGFMADGTAFERPGRVTVTFECREGKWLAVHTHFSLYPRRAG